MESRLQFRAWDIDGERMETEGGYIQVLGSGHYNVYNDSMAEWYSIGFVLMQNIGIPVKNADDIMVGDVLMVKNEPELMATSFAHSKAGKFMLEHGCDIQIEINPCDYLQTNYTMYFIKDGKKMLWCDVYPDNTENVPYNESSDSFYFLKYIANKCEVVGNIFEHSEQFNTFYSAKDFIHKSTNKI